MCHRAFAIRIKLLGNFVKTRTAADGGYPRSVVHGDILKVLEVDYYGTVGTTKA
jgi:hypothetical protein